jgi:hypothetical protein
MTTNLKVKSETNGTLKLKKQNMLRTLFAGLMLGFVSMAGMSFTTDDTTRSNDTTIKAALTAATSDDNGTILNITPSNNPGIRKADLVMDANFRMNEAKNRKMAVAFAKMIAAQASEADEQMSEQLNRNILVASFNSSMSTSVEAADAQMDEMVNDEAEAKAKLASFRTALNVQISQADGEMDVMLNMSTIKNVKPSVAEEADKKIDALMSVKNISPKAGTDADAALDLLINKQ